MRVYFHCYTQPSDYFSIVKEILDSIVASGLSGHAGLYLGLVGPPRKNHEVVEYCRSKMPTEVVNSVPEGWEQVTLNELHEDVQRGLINPKESILYLHSKGASDPSEWNTEWRRAMTSALVRDWKHCQHLLKENDVVCTHWLTPQTFPDKVMSPYAGGNFWWTKFSYLKILEPPKMTNRHEAEAWIGTGNPRVHYRAPGWPSLESLFK